MTLSNSTIATHTRTIPRIEVLAGGSITLTAVARAAHHVFTKRASLLNSRLQVLIRLLLDGLRVLQLLNQLHLEHLHLHHLLFSLRDRLQFLLNVLLHHHPRLLNFSSLSLFNLLTSYLLFHLNCLLLVLVFLSYMLHVLL